MLRVTGLADTGDRYPADTAAAVSFSEAGTSYLATFSATEPGLNIAEVTESGLVQAGAMGNREGLPISAPGDIAALSRLDETLLLIAVSGTSSLSVIRVEDGTPSLADHVLDDTTTRFQGARAIAGLTLGDFAFAAACGSDGGVSLFTVLPGGRLAHIDSVADDETVPLHQVSSLEAMVSRAALASIVPMNSSPASMR